MRKGLSSYEDGAMHDAVPAIAAVGVSPIVRIPDLQPWMVKRKQFSMVSTSVTGSLTSLRCT